MYAESLPILFPFKLPDGLPLHSTTTSSIEVPVIYLQKWAAIDPYLSSASADAE